MSITDQQLKTALKKAAAKARAGDENAERAAKRLAKELKKRREKMGPITRFAGGFDVGVAKTLGAPVDLTASLLRAVGVDEPEAPTGGSVSIQRAMARFGLAPPVGEELGRAGRVGELVGTAATMVPAIVSGGARGATNLATQTITRQPGIAGQISQDVAQAAIQSPKAFVAGETVSAAGAGLASFEVSQRFPDEPGMQMVAEVLGGFTPAGAVLGAKSAVKGIVSAIDQIPLLGTFVVRNARAFVTSLTPRGGVTRAQSRVARGTLDPEATVAKLGRKDILEEAPLTGPQKTEEGGLLALEADVMESTPELSLARQKQLSEVNQVIRNAMEEPVRSIPTSKVKEYLSSLLDTRLAISAARADERIAAVGSKVTREDINRIAREELLRAKDAARLQEKQLHNSIPADARVPTRAGQEAYIDTRLDTPLAQTDDIPKVARRFLDPASDEFLGANTTVKEVRGLQGKLREDARVARAAGEFNKARIADDLADSLNDDISNAAGGAEVREAVDVAVAFSHDLNDRFTRGAVGKVLGREGSGGAKIPESLTLEATVGKRGPRAKVDSDALLEAVRVNVSPENAATAGFSGNEAVMRGHIADFLADDFRRAAVSGGRIDTKAGIRWIDENQDVLSSFPELRRTMDEAIVSGEGLVVAERLADPKVSRAAIFINAPPGREIERVIATAKPKEAMQELVQLARNDTTGVSEQGLKAAFTQFLLRKSELTNSLDALDDPFISGSQLAKQLDDPEIFEAMRGLYSRAELGRIVKIKNTAIAMDRARAAKGSAEGVLGDQPSQLLSLLGRVSGAQIGRAIAKFTGGGTVQTPGILVGETKRLMAAGVRDPATRLLTDAIQDEKLFKALLLPLDTPARVSAVRAKLNAWAFDVLRQQHEFDDKEETE